MTLLVIFCIIAAIVVLSFAYKLGYRAAKKNVMIHAFKEKIITAEQYSQLDKADI